MDSKVVINRLATGVPGLDMVLGGGLPEFSFNLIAGPPGCGKTTLAHQMMFALATPDRPALYFTVLGEPPLKMLRYQQQFDFFDSAKVNRAVRFINLSEETLAGDLDIVLRRIADAVAEHEPALVFVDSFRSVTVAVPGGADSNLLPRFVQHLGVQMSSWQATTFLVGEYFSEDDASPVLAVADGLIWLRQSILRHSMVRKMEIMKMRGQASSPGLHTFRIGRSGIEVFGPPPTPLKKPDDAGQGIDSRLRTGVDALDEMLGGGGLPRGYSLLVAGPSGSGKSILAAAFLSEGARSGETGVIAAFEHQPTRMRNPEIAALIAEGKVALVDGHALDLSVDEILLLLIAKVRRLNATRLVIDSLSGFELTLAPAFHDDFRQSLARLVAALAAEGVTVLMTSELEDRYTDLRFSPYGTAFMTDAIIVQRYIEVGSRLRRMIAVVKVRSSPHSNELREFTIDDSGIHIGAMLVDQEGLLSGRPTFGRGEARVAAPAGA